VSNDTGRCAQAPSEHPGEPVSGARPLVEILYFDGCPNHHPAVALVERVCRELGIEPNLQLVNVPDQEAARRLRFLGSPTIGSAGSMSTRRARSATTTGSPAGSSRPGAA
jgi:hypothetical protein